MQLHFLSIQLLMDLVENVSHWHGVQFMYTGKVGLPKTSKSNERLLS